MHFYKNTGCQIFLVGCLREIPELRMNNNGEFMATFVIDRKKVLQNKLKRLPTDTLLSYQVFVTGQSALRIRQFGFVGLYLWIEGDVENTGKIIAEKIAFLDFPEPGSGKPEKIFSSMQHNDSDFYKECSLTFIDNKRETLNLCYAFH